MSLDLANGWWLATISTACEIAGVRYGSQLKLIES